MKLMMKLFGLVLLLANTAWAAVNINTATQSQLESVKGLGPSKAKVIIEYREKNGPYTSIDDLDKVEGFGKASIEKIKTELTVEGSVVAEKASAKSPMKSVK